MTNPTPPTPSVENGPPVAQSGDAQLFILVEIGKVNAVRNTLYATLLKFANATMKAQIASGYSGASALTTSANTSFWTQAAGHGLQIGVNGYGATAGVREYKNIEDKFNKGTGGIEDLEGQLGDIDSEFTARENGGNGAARLQTQEQTAALEARPARANGTGTTADDAQIASRNSNLSEVSRPELERRQASLKRKLKSKQAKLRKAQDEHKGKLDRYTQITMGLSGLAKSSGETISQNGQASAQAAGTTNSINKDAQQYINSTAQGQEQTANSFAQAAGQAMAASQATAGR
ncbi:MAG: hypothetical protein SP1CHLAM54_17680 [Chlamydiia bacterium]|nr:hypothetical protein [Chlamydiia bacterium]MCH9616656.1 hypothetical protein [Chlamydiia bacterium]MCH9629386.1 hypothetical protein [Chlamydiia bacterium]